jgi:2-polyprenyl-6-methoxyphenol hydroxylase-like FAD-dependent oxidoreductase
MAGYGMTGTMNLVWLLADRVHGWMGEGALDAYQAELVPITEQVSTFAMNHAIALQKER